MINKLKIGFFTGIAMFKEANWFMKIVMIILVIGLINFVFSNFSVLAIGAVFVGGFYFFFKNLQYIKG